MTRQSFIKTDPRQGVVKSSGRAVALAEVNDCRSVSHHEASAPQWFCGRSADKLAAGNNRWLFAVDQVHAKIRSINLEKKPAPRGDSPSRGETGCRQSAPGFNSIVLRHSFGHGEMCFRETTLRCLQPLMTIPKRAATRSMQSLSKRTISDEALAVIVSVVGRDGKHRTNCFEEHHVASGRKKGRRPALSVGLKMLDCRRPPAQQSAAEVTMFLSAGANGLTVGLCHEPAVFVTAMVNFSQSPGRRRGPATLWAFGSLCKGKGSDGQRLYQSRIVCPAVDQWLQESLPFQSAHSE